MSVFTAFKAFFKALKEPEKAKAFIEDQPLIERDDEDVSHLRLLALLQQTGRMVDFLKEDLSEFNDAQVGAAARKIHQDCAKTLEEFVTIRPLMDEEEGSQVQVPKGYDPIKIKVVGKVQGEPPYTGILVHKGWKVHKRSLPRQIVEKRDEVLHPAEVEIR